MWCDLPLVVVIIQLTINRIELEVNLLDIYTIEYSQIHNDDALVYPFAAIGFA